MTTLIEDYALLSDCHTSALVSREGSIDWLCLPRFDSAAVFAALLGTPENGQWRLGLVDGEVTHREYIEDSMVLRTEWTSPTGTAEVIDFMPVEYGNEADDTRHDLVRQVRCTSGTVDIETLVRLRFDYGQATPFFTYSTAGADDECGGETIQVIRAVSGPNAVHVSGPRLQEDADKSHHSGVISLSEGQNATWVLTWFRSYQDTPDRPDHAGALEATLEYWRRWISPPDIHGPYADAIRRSLVVLRALTDTTTGGVVAAPTTSLPEEFGGVRNWDYRYVWLRDSALTIEVLTEVGYVERTTEWRTWLLRAIAGDAHDLRIMYGLGGERRLPELELDHLAGYEDSRPVRIGNEAAEQYQADVVGEVMIALEKIREAGGRETELSWNLQRQMLDFQIDRFDWKDAGIWEMRGEPDYFTHGRAMMWAAFDRGVRAVEKYGYPGDVDTWRRLRDQLREEIMTHGWNDEIQSFTQTYNNQEVDASLLQLAQIGFVDYDDEKMLATTARIEDQLLDSEGFLHRYRTTGSDGLEGDEYPFILCSFWLVEQYAYSGRLAEAKEKMERVLAVRSDLGLLAEEYSTEHGRQAGNYPQAFSHLGLVRAAEAILRAERVE